MQEFAEYPGEKTYRAYDGHMMTVDAQYSAVRKVWYYVYAFAWHSDTCHCSEPYDVSEFAGESE